MVEKTRIAVLVSGGGTNLQAILDAQHAGAIPDGQVVLVVSNKKDAYALTRAENAGVKTAVVLRKKNDTAGFEARLEKVLADHGVELIVLAGFMTILSGAFTAKWPERILNVHPALIPAFCGKGFYGLRVHEAALRCGVKVTGATVHFVNEIPDGGRIVAQKAVSVLPQDTPETLQKRVMEQAEWQILPQAVAQVCRNIRTEKERKEKMNVYQTACIGDLLKSNAYPGRGIIVGKTPDGLHAATAYFIMGRSENSRNRVFRAQGDDVMIYPFDASKVEDPSLIIYAPVRSCGDRLIVTNGDQTDTIRDFLNRGESFEAALETRCFEPDAPNFTPRISAMLSFDAADFSYKMSILKSIDEAGSACARHTYSYPSVNGLGHFIHTYACDGSPIPTFHTEPERVKMLDDIDAFTDLIWQTLNEANKISLFVRFVSLRDGQVTDRLINKHI